MSSKLHGVFIRNWVSTPYTSPYTFFEYVYGSQEDAEKVAFELSENFGGETVEVWEMEGRRTFGAKVETVEA